MEEKKKFWLWFGSMIFTAILGLVGAILGKTIIGYILFGIGLLGTCGLAVFVIKKTDLLQGRMRPWILGLAVGLLLASGIMLLSRYGFRITPLTSSSSSGMSYFSRAVGGNSSSSQNYRSFSGNSGSFGNYSGGNSSGRSGSGSSGSGNFNGSGQGYSNSSNGSSSGRSSGSSSSGSSSRSSSSTTNTAALRQAATRVLETEILGWILLLAGLIVLTVALVRFFKKKTDYSGGRAQALLMGLIVGALVGASVALMLMPSFSHSRRYASANQDQTQQSAASGTLQPPMNPNQGTAAATLSEAPTVTDAAGTSTPVTTVTLPPESTTTVAATLEPTTDATATASLDVISTCLSPSVQVGLNIRNLPSELAKAVGVVPPAGCFLLDGRSSAYPGWYRMAPGQKGMGGILVYVDDTKVPLWIHPEKVDTSEANLDLLADVGDPGSR